MAFDYYEMAWELAEREGLASHERLVLLAVVDHADERGECFPSQARLAGRAGCSERHVRRALKRLDVLGFTHRTPRGNKNGGRSSDLIQLLIPKADRDVR